MKFKNKFQEGGPMPADPAAMGGAPTGQPAGNPMAELLQGAEQAVQSGNCEMGLQVCQMLIELAGGAQAPAPEAAEAPAPAEGEPVYRAGGRLVRRIMN